MICKGLKKRVEGLSFNGKPKATAFLNDQAPMTNVQGLKATDWSLGFACARSRLRLAVKRRKSDLTCRRYAAAFPSELQRATVSHQRAGIVCRWSPAK